MEEVHMLSISDYEDINSTPITNEIEASVGTHPKPRGGNKKKPSRVWKCVTRESFINDKGEKDGIATCNTCQHKMPCSTTRNGTSSILKHLRKCPGSSLYIPPKDSSQQVLSQESFGGAIIPHHFSQKKLEKCVVEWVICAEMSFRAVEHLAYKKMMLQAEPKFKIPGRKKIATGVWDLYLTEKERIMSIIGDVRVCVTTDTWTSIQNINYMVVTAHFLDSDWMLHKRIINFTQITSHKGEDIGRVLDSCLNDWGISKVFSITVDNATANDKAIDYMKKRLKSRGGLLLDGIYMHMRCACHIINLIVKDGMKDLFTSIEGIRNCVKFIHSSPARLEMFRVVAKQEQMDEMATIPMDVATRWNATFGMLTSAYKYRDVFARMMEENFHFQDYFDEIVSKEIDGKKVQGKREGPPVEEDWEKSTAFAHFLEHFYDATITLSATKTPTSHLILEVVADLRVEIESKVNDSTNPTLQIVANSMKAKYDKYWGKIIDVNPTIFVAQILDPTSKLDMIDSVMESFSVEASSIAIFKASIKDKLNALFVTYKDGFGLTEAAKSGEIVEGEDLDSSMDAITTLGTSRKRMLNKRKASQCLEIENEVDKYMNDPFESAKNENFNLLTWWKDNSKKYPILSRIARDVFSIPSSTVASENAFSLGGRVVDPFRASLTPKMVEALVCSSDWLRCEELNFYKKPTEEEVEFYKELEDIEKNMMSKTQLEDVGPQNQIPPPKPPQHLHITTSRGQNTKARR